MLKSLLYTGTLYHKRFQPKEHHFQYPAFYSTIVLSELETLDRNTRFFSYNSKNILSLYDKDYIDTSTTPLIDKAKQYLRKHNFSSPVDTYILLTSPRYFNYVFNPVSFIYVLSNNSIQAVIAQVNNTFGERHLYPLFPDENGGFSCRKEFHVSPFFDLNGYYRFHFSDLGPKLSVGISYFKDAEKQLYAKLSGKGQPFTSPQVLKTIFKFPLLSTLNFPRITKEALKLYYLKKLTIHPKPVPTSPNTFYKQAPSFFQKIAQKITLRFLSQLDGCLNITLPSQPELTLGKASHHNLAKFTILDHRFFTRVLKFRDIGFGESYMNGEWVTDNLTALIRFFINANPKDKAPSFLTRIWHHINVRSHRKKANSKENAKANISSHYDLNNDFFKLFLDSSMMYSSALFKNDDDTLEKAQKQKMSSLISRLQVSSEDTVLEIGSGWGALAIAIAKQTGAKVHTITLSNEQHDYVQETIKSEQLESLVTVSISDYREIRTQYDAIVSVEMIEAVGHRYLKTYFNAVSQALKPGGRFVLQGITIPNNRYNTYRKNCDFIQKHIFPGGHLPSPGIIESLSKSATLTQNHYLELGQSYAKTLSHWKTRLLAQKEAVLSLGFSDQFIRKFEYYFSYCEAGFLEKVIHVGQYQFIKNEER